MKQEDKELLIRDLCARLPYGVIVEDRNGVHPLTTGNTEFAALFGGSGWHNIKPYLRPMSSMTDAEWADCVRSSNIPYDGDEQHCIVAALMADARARWYDKKMFDHRGLLPRGLAYEMPEGMYK